MPDRLAQVVEGARQVWRGPTLCGRGVAAARVRLGCRDGHAATHWFPAVRTGTDALAPVARRTVLLVDFSEPHLTSDDIVGDVIDSASRRICARTQHGENVRQVRLDCTEIIRGPAPRKYCTSSSIWAGPLVAALAGFSSSARICDPRCARPRPPFQLRMRSLSDWLLYRLRLRVVTERAASAGQFS